jgi:hypothetical protein
MKMKKLIVIILIGIFFVPKINAQTASDILEKGIPVRMDESIFLKYDPIAKELKIDASRKDQEVNFTTLEDSTLYLIRKNQINVYLRPLNPLKFSYKSDVKLVVDPVDEAAEKAMDDIFKVLQSLPETFFERQESKTGTEKADGKKGKKDVELVKVTCLEFDRILLSLDSALSALNNNPKDKILKIETELSGLDFAERQKTLDELNKARNNVKEINDHFEAIKGKLDRAQKLLVDLNCPFEDLVWRKMLFSLVIKDFRNVLEEQKKRLNNLVKAVELVENEVKIASSNDPQANLSWVVPLKPAKLEKGKIAVFSVSIDELGTNVLNADEKKENKNVSTRTIQFRKYQTFVPEISAGVAFTFFKYYTYGTSNDSAGFTTNTVRVASPKEEVLKNINITAMINWNFFTPLSPIHPLIQLGAGVNAELPTLFLGGGLRFSNNPKNRFRVTGGIACTWMKELNELEVGDVVSGTDDINKDLKYDPFPRLKPYLGFQYNF